MSSRPLTGSTVLCLGGPATVVRLASQISRLGGTALRAPAFHLLPGDRAGLRAALEASSAGTFGGICLTSSEGVVALARELRWLEIEPPAVLGELIIGSVGPGTTRTLLDRLDTAPDIEPAVSTGKALGMAFPRGRGSVLLPLSDLASGSLEAALRSRGWTPVRITAYLNRRVTRLPTTVEAAIRRGQADLVALTSSSAARAYVELVDVDRRATHRVVSIGPSTSATCAELEVPVVAEAPTHDLDGLANALVGTCPSSKIKID